MKTTANFHGRTAVVTGATGGIGRAIAKQLDAAGARLILVARDAVRLADLQGQLRTQGHKAISADLATESGRSAVLDACRVAGNPGISLLVNSAGINDFDLFAAQSPDAIRRMVDINLVSPILLCQALLPLLHTAADGQIVNIGSTFGSIGYPGFGAYCASKFGLRGFTEALRRELDGTPLRVTYIAPRATRTDLNSDAVIAMNDALGTAMDDPEAVAREVIAAIHSSSRNDQYIGWPEKLFVRVNAIFPGLVDKSLRKQLPIIRRFATQKT